MKGKAIKGVILGAFAGLASIPGFFYALVVRPVQSVDTGTVKTEVQQTAVLHSASHTGRVLFALGLFFLILLIVFIVLGFMFQRQEINDEK